MKLKNKRTGEIVEWFNNTDGIFPGSLAELNEEWEDTLEEPKGMQWVDVLGANDGRVVIQYLNEEEAEKAVKRLRAWKRLKDKGFRISHWCSLAKGCLTVSIKFDEYIGISEDNNNDLDLLFGGEE